MSELLLRQVQSYEVIVQRSAETPHRRVLRLALKPVRGNPVKAAELVFEASPKSFGDLSGPLPRLILPLEDFTDCYHVLQTENPVHLYATAKSGAKANYVGLTTDPEALGEGLRDADA